jgi:hypothetical protein
LLSVLADEASAAGCRVVAANVRSGDELTLELASEVIDRVESDHDGRTVMVLDGLEPMRTTATCFAVTSCRGCRRRPWSSSGHGTPRAWSGGPIRRGRHCSS